MEANPLTQIALPTRMMEFASLSKPLVLPQLTYLQEVVGDAAEYYTPGDAISLRDALNRVVGTDAETARRVERASAICRKFDWTRNRSSFVNLCETVGGLHVR